MAILIGKNELFEDLCHEEFSRIKSLLCQGKRNKVSYKGQSKTQRQESLSELINPG